MTVALALLNQTDTSSLIAWAGVFARRCGEDLLILDASVRGGEGESKWLDPSEERSETAQVSAIRALGEA